VIGRVWHVIGGVAAFLWDFVVGDDWRAAVGVVVLLGAGAALVHLAHVNAWWLLPPGVAAIFAASVRRAARAARLQH
jgi:hypothetical protein